MSRASRVCSPRPGPLHSPDEGSSAGHARRAGAVQERPHAATGGTTRPATTCVPSGARPTRCKNKNKKTNQKTLKCGPPERKRETDRHPDPAVRFRFSEVSSLGVRRCPVQTGQRTPGTFNTSGFHIENPHSGTQFTCTRLK